MFSKTAIITGSNRGIGKEISTKLASSGFNLILCSRSINDDFKIEIEKKYNVKVFCYYFDLKNINETIKASKEILKFSIDNELNINLLVNNAGSIKVGLFQMDNYNSFKEIFDINFFSQVFFTQSIIPALKKMNNSSIINISSTSAFENDFGRISYNASKAALISFTKSLAKELVNYKIRVNCIAPGLIDTEMLRNNSDKNIIENMIKNNLSKRIGTTSDIAELVLFLASEKSNYINSQVIRIDGGMN